MTLSDRAAVELFHLCFMRTFLVGPEKQHVVVKGGCNLRFFFGSVRYSEDIDFDVAVIAQNTLKKNVDKVLAGEPLARQLATQRLTLETVSAPKQTPTTQRWKVSFSNAAGASLHSKIEFSRRETNDVGELASVAPRLLRRYALSPVLARHYVLHAAIRQKVQALAGRPTTQARDIFDLGLLLALAGEGLLSSDEIGSELSNAAKRILDVGYDEYSAQVLAYLEPDEREPYASVEAWDALQLQVLSGLERMGP